MTNRLLLSLLFFLSFGLSFTAYVNAQSDEPETTWSFEFLPGVNGFKFPNYRNVGNRWKDDINADDLIRMFGRKAVCLKADTALQCDLKPQARTWMERQLKAMDIGHCEGISVASLRLFSGLPFKKRNAPPSFQTGARRPFDLSLDQNLENYIAYYWITQTFREVSDESDKSAVAGPVKIAQTLIDSFSPNSDKYTLSIWKYDKGRRFDGHTITPFAVEDLGDQFKISVYDNNIPGKTLGLLINKNGSQRWTYTAGKEIYAGDVNTLTLRITSTSSRDNRCFKPSFSLDGNRAVGCGKDVAMFNRNAFVNAAYNPSYQQNSGEDAEFFLTGEGDMLVSIDSRPIVGYDPATNRYYDDPVGGESELLKGGFGMDLPHFVLPYERSGKPYTITFSGEYLDEESTLDFVFSAPGFTVGFDGIMLDPDEILIAEISSDGQEISFTASKDGETPEVFYSFGAEDEEGAGYVAYIGGISIDGGKSLFYDFEFENGKLYFSDDDGNEDEYDIELIRINADGTEQSFKKDNLNIGHVDKYELDFGNWDGEGEPCFKDDEDGDGFDDEECDLEEEPEANSSIPNLLTDNHRAEFWRSF